MPDQHSFGVKPRELLRREQAQHRVDTESFVAGEDVVRRPDRFWDDERVVFVAIQRGFLPGRVLGDLADAVVVLRRCW